MIGDIKTIKVGGVMFWDFCISKDMFLTFAEGDRGGSIALFPMSFKNAFSGGYK